MICRTILSSLILWLTVFLRRYLNALSILGAIEIRRKIWMCPCNRAMFIVVVMLVGGRDNTTATTSTTRGQPVFQTSRRHNQILRARRMTWSSLHIEDPQFWSDLLTCLIRRIMLGAYEVMHICACKENSHGNYIESITRYHRTTTTRCPTSLVAGYNDRSKFVTKIRVASIVLPSFKNFVKNCVSGFLSKYHFQTELLESLLPHNL
jgi:hypothetical protein